MQAAQVDQFGEPSVLREIVVTPPGPGQILVKAEARGICHTDPDYVAHIPAGLSATESAPLISMTPS